MKTIETQYMIKESRISAFKNIASEIVKESKLEKGCISYELIEEFQGKNKFTIIEQWENEECLKLHNKSIHIKFLMPKLNEYKEELELESTEFLKGLELKLENLKIKLRDLQVEEYLVAL